MFASQLLRILQSIPSDVKYETCVFDPDEQDMTMKEKQNSVLYDAKQFGREANDNFGMENTEIYQLNDSKTDTVPVAFNVKARDGHWNPFLDDSSVEEDDSYQLSSESHMEDKSRKNDGSMEVDDTHLSEKDKSRNSSPSGVDVSDFSEKGTNMFTDKNVLDCVLPEFKVCYKEINYHIVKDICVDEGLPVKDKSLLGNSKHEESIFKPHENNPFLDTEGGVDMESFIPEELATSSLNNNKGENENERGIKEGTGNLNSELLPKSCLEKDSAEHTASEDSMLRAGETKYDTTGYDGTDASKEESFIDKRLPIQEFGTRSFLRSFMSSLDFEEHRVDQPPDQIPSGKAVSGIPATPATETVPEDDIQATSLLYNSKVENGSITFNFNEPVVDDGTEHVNELSAGLEILDDHECATSNSLSEPAQVELSSNSDNCKENSPAQQSKNSMNKEKIDVCSPITQVELTCNNDDCKENSRAQHSMNSANEEKIDVSSPAKQVELTSNDENCKENPHTQQSTNLLNEEKTDDSSPATSILSISENELIHENTSGVNIDNPEDRSIGDQHSHENDEQAVETNKHGPNLKREVGETSFSAASLINYSGPVAYSGSLSIRSDGSAASGRSFAFPVLPNEWNSSPVRMAKADRRHYRKHRGWKLGLPPCCRF